MVVPPSFRGVVKMVMMFGEFILNNDFFINLSKTLN
jgi:hypothetical protein